MVILLPSNLKANMSFYDIKISGKDVPRFIYNLHKMHINILNIEKNEKEAIIKVSSEDYKKIKEIKTIYQVKIVKAYGFAKIKLFIKKYLLFLIMLLLGLLLFLGLTNIIFDVEVIHDNKELRELVLNELKNEGISKYHFVVSYKQKEKIKENILNKYHDKIDWIEIERQGTKYEIKVEERKQVGNESDTNPCNIVAKKNGVIKKIVSSSGEIIAKKDQYVKKGDILISGTIHNKEEIVANIKASGTIYAETWYTVTVELPYHYHEEKLTTNKQTILQFNWFSKTINFFRFDKYKNSNLITKYKIKNSFLPITLSLIEENEIEIEDYIYTKDNAILSASNIAKKRLKEKLGDNISILYEKNLKIIEENSKIKIVMFYKVYEDITEYQNITLIDQLEE